MPTLEDVIEFENDVKMYGIQTLQLLSKFLDVFENDVKMYGIQTLTYRFQTVFWFENDVKMYGIQTDFISRLHSPRLRMM